MRSLYDERAAKLEQDPRLAKRGDATPDLRDAVEKLRPLFGERSEPGPGA